MHQSKHKKEEEKEVWKKVEGHEKFYEVSNLGRVYSVRRGRTLGSYKNRQGYFMVKLCVDGEMSKFRVHRLVAIAFLPRSREKKEINHKNGIKTDNRLVNLEWCTRSYNTTHAWRTGLRKSTGRCRKCEVKLVAGVNCYKTALGICKTHHNDYVIAKQRESKLKLN